MKRAVSIALVMSAALAAGGCGIWPDFGDDDVKPPAELVAFKPQIDIDRVWSEQIGDGSGETRVNLSIGYGGDTIYAAGRYGTVKAMNAETGDVQWKVETDVELISGPSVGDGLLLLGGMNGEVLALSRSDGSRRWLARTSSEVLAKPVVSDGVVVARSLDDRLFGFAVEDGARLWSVEQSMPSLTVRGKSSPIAFDGTVAVGFDNGQVLAFDVSDGTQVWQQTVAVPGGRTQIERMVDLDGQLARMDTDLFAASLHGRVAGMALESGRVFWVRDMSSFTGVSVAGPRLYVTDDESHVWALDRRSGASLWQQKKMARRQLGVPVGYRDYVVAGDFEGYLHWLDRAEGAIVGRTRVDDWALTAAPVVGDGLLYVLSEGGRLVAYTAEER